MYGVDRTQVLLAHFHTSLVFSEKKFRIVGGFKSYGHKHFLKEQYTNF